MGKSQRTKGASEERAIVNLHRELGMPREKALRVPLSGLAEGYKHDVILNNYTGECKVRKSGFKQIYDWIDKEPDFLTIRVDRKQRLYILPEITWIKIIKEAQWIK
mgnify:FL=1|jgi:hypothetical protein|tara:strand:+ start:3913 stop:4230 length:318 start_codon:yes stop_codon:yes gene_type:complete